MLSYVIPLLCFWNTITNEVLKYKQEVVSNNIVSLIHCVLFIVHYHYDYNVEYATHMSIAYYTHDLLYIISSIYKLKSRDEFKRWYPFILHHIFGIYLLKQSLTGESKEHLLHGYNILETSNIMLYVSYHIYKEYGKYFHLITISEFFQMLWYLYFRIAKFSLYVYTNKTHFIHFTLSTQVVIVAIYCMGAIWSYKLVRKNIKNFNRLLRELRGYDATSALKQP
jgi:hypothetical protein